VKVVGSGATFATNALTIQNSSNANLFRVQNDGAVFVGTFQAFSTSSNIGFFLTGSSAINIGGTNATNFANTNTFVIARPYSPSGGTFQHNLFSITSTINQTGGANGITRGLYVNPTLTAAADWRSIEWSNNSGWGLYGAGTAANFIAGNLLLGASTPNSGERLQVTGTMKVTGNSSFSSGTSTQGTLIVPSTSNIYTNYSGINTHGIYNSATSTTNDVWVGYVGGGATANIYTYFRADGYIGTRGGIRLGAATGTDVATVLSNSWLGIAAGTTTRSQINLASSTAPTSPANGDIWFDGTDIKMRIGGVTKTFTLL
jgi:hypothetical protein